MLNNRATAEATAAYGKRFAQLPENYRLMLGLSVSSIGIGTYLGDNDAATDARYEEAVRAALLGGINLIDTAVNYRNQMSERLIGRVIAQMVAAGQIKREEIVIATKGGYIAFDCEMPADPRAWFQENFIRTGIIGPGDLVQGSHCMTPRYLDAMIERSRANLGLETIDIYYLHNPESQLGAIGRDEFHRRIRAAFEFLEGAVAQGRIACYGAATWNGYRAKPADASYLAIAGMVKLAADVGGDDHHFRVIQLPYNLAMPEALTLANQELNDGRKASALAAADANGLAVCASASLLQGQLTRGLPAIVADALAGMESDAQRSLQFVRSTPGIKVALVGMSAPAHVAHNLATAGRPPAPFDQLMKLFQPATA